MSKTVPKRMLSSDERQGDAEQTPDRMFWKVKNLILFPIRSSASRIGIHAL